MNLAAEISFEARDIAGSLVTGLALLAITLPILSRHARMERDRAVFILLFAALIAKMIGAFVRFYFSFGVYGGVADATGYHNNGLLIGDLIRGGLLGEALELAGEMGYSGGTEFISFLTGVVYTVTGPNLLGGFLVYSWFAFIGLLFFYKAYLIAIPEGRSRSYARLLFFMPSLLFWPSSIGKEAWMILWLGIAAYGMANILSGKLVRGVTCLALAIPPMAIVRIHVTGMVAIALLAAYLIKRPARGWLQLAPVVKGGAMIAAAIISALLVVRVGTFLQDAEATRPPSDFIGALADTAERTTGGGSSIEPTVVNSPVEIPVAGFNVLFRPLVFEAGTDLAVLGSAFETTFLLGLFVYRWRWVIASLKLARRRPYLVVVVTFILLFIIAFSSFGNLGLLARQRSQVLPFFLVLLAIPPPPEHEEHNSSA